MNRTKKIRRPRGYAQLLATRHPASAGLDAQQAALRIRLNIPLGQRVPSRQERRAAARR